MFGIGCGFVGMEMVIVGWIIGRKVIGVWIGGFLVYVGIVVGL